MSALKIAALGYATPGINHRPPPPQPDAPGTIPDKLPPHSVETEEALLCSILNDGLNLAAISSIGLTGADFYIERNGWIFDAALALHTTGQRPNIITIQDALERVGRWDDIGDPAALLVLLALTSPIYAAPDYARIIKENSNRRRGLALAGELARLYHQPGDIWPQVGDRIQVLTESTTNQEWQIFSLKDAYAPRPPLSWVVSGLLALPSLNVVFGPPGTLKSMLLTDLALCVATGKPWLTPLPGEPARPFATTAAPVLWLDFDNGQRLTSERFEAIGRAHDAPESAPLFYVSMPSPWLNASDILQVDGLAMRVLRLGAKLVVVDNLSTVAGGKDENSAEMVGTMSNLRRLAEKSGAAVVVVHHQRKSNGLKGREGDTLRGHSSILAALDLALLLERAEDDLITLKSTKTRLTDVMPFAALWTFEHKPDSHELQAARFFGKRPPVNEDEIIIRQAIESAAKSHPGLSQTKLRDTVKAQVGKTGGYVAIRNEILELVTTGQLSEKNAGKGHAASYYWNDDHISF